jgi:AAA+ ATPase superfamily predicted ATPase
MFLSHLGESRMSFYGREHVLNDLERRLRAVRGGTGLLLAVRGRRQVGKSRLFTRFVEGAGLPYLYFTAVKGASASAQLAAFTNGLRTSTRPLRDADALFAAPPADWSDALGRIAVACRDMPSIVVMDEFPWAVVEDPTLEGQLQNAWDRQLERLPVLFVLIGSDVTMMERLTEHDRPLFGRARELTVRPFNPAECAAAFGGDAAEVSAVDVFDAALVTGGYPRLVLDHARAGGDARAFVHEQFQDENSDLVVMGQRSLDAEFPDARQTRRVLSAIGAQPVGVSSFSQVVGRLPEEGGTAQTAVTRAIGVLERKGVVAVDVPYGAGRVSRLRRYRVADPYLRFWFRFVEGQESNIARGRADIAVGAFERGWTNWRGRAVEPLVQEALSRLGPELPWLAADAEPGLAHGWWNRDNSREYDVVLPETSGQRVLALGSVKWREGTPFTGRDLDRLAEGRHYVPGAARAVLLAVCPAGVAPDARPDQVLTPPDLLAAWRPSGG